eukprot:EG_transcript_13338
MIWDSEPHSCSQPGLQPWAKKFHGDMDPAHHAIKIPCLFLFTVGFGIETLDQPGPNGVQCKRNSTAFSQQTAINEHDAFSDLAYIAWGGSSQPAAFFQPRTPITTYHVLIIVQSPKGRLDGCGFLVFRVE